MAKSSKARWIGVGFTALVVIAAVIGSAVWAQADIKAVDVKADGIMVAVSTLKVEGCAPAKEAETDIAVIKSELTTIKDTVKEMRVEQRAGTKLILEAIRAQ